MFLCLTLPVTQCLSSGMCFVSAMPNFQEKLHPTYGGFFFSLYINNLGLKMGRNLTGPFEALVAGNGKENQFFFQCDSF